MPAAAEGVAHGVDIDGRVAFPFIGLGAQRDFGEGAIAVVLFGEECDDADGGDGLREIDEAAGLTWAGFGVFEVLEGDRHDGGVFLLDDVHRFECAGHEFESAGPIALVEHRENAGMVHAGIEELAGEAHHSAINIGMLEPAGVGREPDIERHGDFDGEG